MKPIPQFRQFNKYHFTENKRAYSIENIKLY